MISAVNFIKLCTYLCFERRKKIWQIEKRLNRYTYYFILVWKSSVPHATSKSTKKVFGLGSSLFHEIETHFGGLLSADYKNYVHVVERELTDVEGMPEEIYHWKCSIKKCRELLVAKILLSAWRAHDETKCIY